jgi:hypothetical protein
MGTCFSKPTEDETPSLGTRDVTSQEPSSSQQQRGANPGRDPAHVTDVSSYGRRPIRDRSQSSPHKVPPMNDMESPPLPRQRTRAKSSVALSSNSNRGPNLDQRQTSAGECDHGWACVPPLQMFTNNDKSTQGLLPDELCQILSPAGRSILKCKK